jgi:hypothetical protein
MPDEPISQFELNFKIYVVSLLITLMFNSMLLSRDIVKKDLPKDVMFLFQFGYWSQKLYLCM